MKMLGTVVLGTMLGAILFNNVQRIVQRRVPQLAPVVDGTLLAGG